MNKKLIKKVRLENLTKNLFILLLLFVAYPPLKQFLLNSSLYADNGASGSVLVAVSILAVTACFGNFAFTYEKIKLDSSYNRILAHFTTGLLMLLIGLSLEMTSLITGLLVENFYILNFSLIILYISSVMYDFWDLERLSL